MTCGLVEGKAMSIYGMMRTGASGMNAQSDRLSAVADNIANAATTGYKAAATEFSSLLLGSSPSSYTSGAVETSVRRGIASQGALTFSSSPFDLAISGGGFLLAEDPSGRALLTRAGAFVPDGDGRLVNSAGLLLLGLRLTGGADGVVLNGTAGLEPVVVNGAGLEAAPTTEGLLTVNLPADADQIAAAALPSANAAGATSTGRSSVVVYDDLGASVVLDVHFARTQVAGEWEVAVFNSADRAGATGFPYASAALAQATLSFDANGNLAGATTSIAIPVPGGATMMLDLAGSTQLAADFAAMAVDANGNEPSEVASVEITSDGTVYETYESGARLATFRIPLASVVSPDQLSSISGNVFLPTAMSGDIRVGFAEQAGMGSIVAGALEQSTVDLAGELTSMIEAQRNYSANSKVFQTGSELLDILVNLKR